MLNGCISVDLMEMGKVPRLEKKVVVEGHCVASSDATLQLAFSTSSDEFLGVFLHRWPDEFLGVFLHRWPEESTLPKFGLCAEYYVMASVWCCMSLFNDLQTFRRWYTSPQQDVRAYRVIPKVTSAFDLQLSFVFAWWYVS